jgi:hypothetical protein
MTLQPMTPPSWFDGVLSRPRFLMLNKHLHKHGSILGRDEIIDDFCLFFGIPRWRVEAELATYRLLSPDQWQ